MVSKIRVKMERYNVGDHDRYLQGSARALKQKIDKVVRRRTGGDDKAQESGGGAT
jgi:hypothetical protein